MVIGPRSIFQQVSSFVLRCLRTLKENSAQKRSNNGQIFSCKFVSEVFLLVSCVQSFNLPIRNPENLPDT